MRYNRYAMPIDPRVLQNDFQSTSGFKSKIENTINLLNPLEKNDDIPVPYLEQINRDIRNLWFEINEGRGVNLKDREKLYPVFKELDRIFGNGTKHSEAYRGTRLSSFDPNALSNTYSDLEIGDTIIPKESKVITHLENLAYGLRSWTTHMEEATIFMNAGNHKYDRVVFEIENPNIVLDANPLIRYFQSKLKTNYMNMIDWDELILYVRKPQIISIKKELFHDDDLFFIVRIKS